MTTTTEAQFGTTIYNVDPDGHSGRSRGIVEQGGAYTAYDHAAFSKRFKTLAGAVRFMKRMGYDAHGRRR